MVPWDGSKLFMDLGGQGKSKLVLRFSYLTSVVCNHAKKWRQELLCGISDNVSVGRATVVTASSEQTEFRLFAAHLQARLLKDYPQNVAS